ncbi:aurora kinase A and ninein-interacting protein isoform X1 [Hippocampus comes]|uniref:aurora kinase A and ninein-interacting protein isoform X1 n=2 Tax=Hippocampus comes TaxID=109280 RepID=UPI00094E7A84|nr:PREDICTED: aurora kinase A and ninein-interacting protein isoform X1 [Hippocampus comes]
MYMGAIHFSTVKRQGQPVVEAPDSKNTKKRPDQEQASSMKTCKGVQSNPAPEECGVWLDTVELKGKAKQKKTVRPISKMLNPLAKAAGYSSAVVFNFTQTKTEMPRTKQSFISSYFSPRSKSDVASEGNLGPETDGEMCEDGDAQEHDEEHNINCEIQEEQPNEMEKNIYRKRQKDEMEQNIGRKIREEQPDMLEQKIHRELGEEQPDMMKHSISSKVGEEQPYEMEQNIRPPVRQPDKMKQIIHGRVRKERQDETEQTLWRQVREEQPDKMEREVHLNVPEEQQDEMNHSQESSLPLNRNLINFDVSEEAFRMEVQGKKTSTQKLIRLAYSSLNDDKKESSPLPEGFSPPKKRARQHDDEDSLVRLFTQDSDGFRVIAHRGRRSPLKNRNNNIVVAAATRKPMTTPFDVKDVLFTQDSQGNMVIKH